MATTVLTDAELLRDVRDLFRLSLDEVEPIGLSRSTWARIEQDVEAAHTRGVEQRLAVLRRLMTVLGAMAYRQARAWAVTPLPRRRENPREILVSGIGGANYLLRELAGRREPVGL